jgi:type VI secretion system secreted protein Hcp
MSENAGGGTSRRDLLKVGTLGFGAIGGAALFPGVAAGAPVTETSAIPSDPRFLYFLKLGDIKGESSYRGYEDQIQLLGWSWGVTSASSPLGSGGSASKSKPSDFVFVAPSTVASPVIMLACASGRHLKAATLSVGLVAQPRTVPFVVTFTNVFVTSYQTSSGDTDGHPVDVVRLAYGKVTSTARRQNDDGSLGSDVTRAFDFVSNTTG